MRFQTKMIVAYAMFSLLIAGCIGIFYHNYNFTQYKQMEEKNLEIMGDQLGAQMDEMIRPMELAFNYILSDSNILPGISLLSRQHEDNDNLLLDAYRVSVVDDIQKGISTDYLTYQFYRTIFFNQDGIAVSTYRSSEQKMNSGVVLSKMPWLEELQNSRETTILVEPHLDTWRKDDGKMVISLVKQIQGKGMGYIEVQKLASDLKDELKTAKDDVDFLIFSPDHKLLYTTKRIQHIEEYVSLVKENGAFSKTVDIDGEEIILKRESERYGIKVLIMENTKILSEESDMLMPMTFIIAGIFFGISMIFVMILSSVLAKPIRQLRQVMEKTDLSNLGEDMDIKVDIPNDEIMALNLSYQKALERLQQAIDKEKKMSVLQLQAQFDVLQSQVNPHFLYNVLNVISGRGMSNGDEEICEICGSLATMLRYSTNTKTRYAALKDEIVYVEQYFYLLKARYEHKLEYEIQIESEIETQIVPKMVLQQIVENCINHGFENSTGHMKVTINGYRKAENWIVEIHDNGQGFKEESMKELHSKFENTKRSLLKEKSGIEMEIGGIGLVNSYARMLLLYNENLIFTLSNDEDGAVVILGGDMQEEHGMTQSKERADV